jgi:hypothetical protein
LVGWDFSRTATFNVQDALLNPKAIAMQAGTELESKIEKILKREVLLSVDAGTGTESKLTLAKEPVELMSVVETTDGYDQVQDIPLTGATITANEVTIPATDLPIGTQVIVYYEFETLQEAEVITITSNDFGGYYKVYGDTFWRNEKTGQDEMVQLVIDKAKVMSNFTLTMQPDGDPSVFDFNLDVFKSPDSTDMVRFIRYTE